MEINTQRMKSATTPVTLCPLGDIQWSGDRDDLAYDQLQGHIATCLKSPNPIFVGLGDYIDFASPSTREALKAVKYDTPQKVIKDATKGLVDSLFKEILRPTAGKWAGLVEGHHWNELNDDGEHSKQWHHSDAYLSRLLKTKFLEELGVVFLEFPGGGRIGIFVQHGNGSSTYPWGPLVQLYRRVPAFDLDIFLLGHQTKKTVGELDHLKFPADFPEHIEHRTRHLVGCGGWTKGYVVGRRTYISEKGLTPVALGQPLIHIRPSWRVSSKTGKKVWDPGISVEV